MVEHTLSLKYNLSQAGASRDDVLLRAHAPKVPQRVRFRSQSSYRKIRVKLAKIASDQGFNLSSARYYSSYRVLRRTFRARTGSSHCHVCRFGDTISQPNKVSFEWEILPSLPSINPEDPPNKITIECPSDYAAIRGHSNLHSEAPTITPNFFGDGCATAQARRLLTTPSEREPWSPLGMNIQFLFRNFLYNILTILLLSPLQPSLIFYMIPILASIFVPAIPLSAAFPDFVNGVRQLEDDDNLPNWSSTLLTAPAKRRPRHEEYVGQDRDSGQRPPMEGALVKRRNFR